MRGKVLRKQYTTSRERDHPRLCGEKCPLDNPPHLAAGSPPPMRGKGTHDASQRSGRRITPAYAGKSICTCGLWLLVGDHPRLCGEKSSTSVLYLTIPGSPPPMRGKVASIFVPAISSRITPAYAGKSPVLSALGYI